MAVLLGLGQDWPSCAVPGLGHGSVTIYIIFPWWLTAGRKQDRQAQHTASTELLASL